MVRTIAPCENVFCHGDAFNVARHISATRSAGPATATERNTRQYRIDDGAARQRRRSTRKLGLGASSEARGSVTVVRHTCLKRSVDIVSHCILTSLGGVMSSSKIVEVNLDGVNLVFCGDAYAYSYSASLISYQLHYCDIILTCYLFMQLTDL